MEARSLTALNDLANHPPKYPEAPIRGKGEPFTLYISRVPGTRDIILSPSKPQPNSVTSSDVDNCLYYVHLETAADGSTPSDLARHDWQSRPEAGGTAPLTIPRKPVPQAARPLTPESLSSDGSAASKPTEAQNMEVETSDDVVLADPPLPSKDGHDLTIDMALEPKHASDRTAAGLHTGMPVRKPLGPRPIDTAIPPTSVPLPDSAISPDRMQHVALDGNDASARDTLVKSLPLPPVDTCLPSPGLDGSDAQPMAVSPPSSGVPKSRSPSPTGHGSTASRGSGSPFALTLIRRDPSSGIQWTVGRIFSSKSNQPEDHVEHDSGVPATSSQPPLPRSYPPIEVELETSGYAQFRSALFTSMGHQTDAVCDALAQAHMEARSKTKGGNDVFSRQLVMGYTKSLGAVLTEGLREVLQRIEQAGFSKIGRNRSDSTASAVSNMSEAAREARDTVDTIVTAGPPPQGMRAKGYVFLSPWGRKCEFSTSPSGRGVYCRHMPREVQAHHDPSNPLSLEQNGSSILGPPTHVVSELRFSLPSTEKLAEHAKMSKEHLRKANFGKLLRPGNSANDGEGGGFDVEEFLSPFFANLGSERAGGGSRGKKAKMGKLIIHEDGFKMLDLVVATNIGMWWAAWERNF